MKEAKDSITSLGRRLIHCKDLRFTLNVLGAKLEDLEGCSRRNNICLVGVPEKAEGPVAALFVEDFILKVLQPRGLSNDFSFEWAHRVPGTSPNLGGPPHSIRPHIFNFRDWNMILHAAGCAPPVKSENTAASFFPNFTLPIQELRCSFAEVKCLARARFEILDNVPTATPSDSRGENIALSNTGSGTGLARWATMGCRCPPSATKTTQSKPWDGQR
ncbi:hypothetical protein NDU88_010613 [Pleurodeles waltl]|uniref:Uncharacterized protein n=1 Tax=Pleurodeles waltl TaxID=8319 RepID=A0AAV7PYV5_PLEWA|nr:hypothetical protein NDU88_010613 [Pleurodeles waltl]